MKTFLQIANAVAMATDEDNIPTLEGENILDSTVRLKMWLNDGYRYIFRKVFKSDIIKQEGTSLINAYTTDLSQLLISKFDEIKIDDVPLKILTYKEFRKIKKTYGKPLYASIFQGELYLKPIPDRSYNIDYFGTAQFMELEFDNDIPIVDPQLLILYGIYEQRSYDKQYSDAGAYEAFRIYLNAYISTFANTVLNQVNLREKVILPEDALD